MPKIANMPLLGEIPHITSLLINNRGQIQDVLRNKLSLFPLKREEMVGKRIEDILVPLGTIKADFITLKFINKNPICPDNLFATIKGVEFADDIFVFLFYYSRCFSIKGKECRIVFLMDQSFNSPVIQKHLSLSRLDDAPMVLLDDKFKIVFFNLPFFALVDFIDQDRLYGTNILNLLCDKCRQSNPFDFAKKIDYINKNVDPASAWNLLYNFDSAQAFYRVFNASFIKNRDLRGDLKNDFMAIRIASQDNATPYLLFEKAVNHPDLDLKIEIECRLEPGNNISMGLGHPYHGKVLHTFNPSYHLDIKLHDKLYCNFNRRSVCVRSGNSRRVKPGAFFKLTFSRTGACFSLAINDKLLLDFPDPFPIFGNLSSHLHFYIWGKSIFGIRRFNIYSKNNRSNIDKLAGQGIEAVSFKAAPGTPYRFTADTVSYGNKSALAVRFIKIPVTLRNSNKDGYIAQFEEARQFIQNNFSKKIDYKLLARKCCVSYKYFITLFRNYYGFTPKSYQIERRLAEAALLLKNKEYTVEDICQMVGFNDEANFRRMFKRRFKKSPRCKSL